MTSPEARKTIAAPALDLSATKAAVWLSLTAFLACWCSTSSAWTRARRRCSATTRMIHEFVHDARHLLGFPCH